MTNQAGPLIHVADDHFPCSKLDTAIAKGMMVTDGNTMEYYRSREQREATMAETARDPAIAAIHRDLATRYAVLATETAIAGLPSARMR